MHGACTRNVNFFVAPTYLFVFPSIRPYVHSNWPSRTRGAPFVRMLMPTAFRDAIQFSSLTLADLLRRMGLRVKVRATMRGSFRRRQTAVSSRRTNVQAMNDFVVRNEEISKRCHPRFSEGRYDFPVHEFDYRFLLDAYSPLFPRSRTYWRGFVTNLPFHTIFFFRSSTEDRRPTRVSEKHLYRHSEMQNGNSYKLSFCHLFIDYWLNKAKYFQEENSLFTNY